MGIDNCICTKKRWKSVFLCRLLPPGSIKKRSSYPIPKMNERKGSLGKAQIFSALDACSVYCLIELDKKDIHKTAFVTLYGRFECTHTAFGLKNAPATFQRAINAIFASVKLQRALE